MLDGLHSAHGRVGEWYSGGRKQVTGWQPVSPQVSPSNELWTSCFGWSGLEPAPHETWMTPAREQVALTAGLAHSLFRYRENSAASFFHIMHIFLHICLQGKCVWGKYGGLILGNKKKTPFLMQMQNSNLCYCCTVYLSRTPDTEENVSILFDGSLMISILWPSPHHPHPHISSSP